jgi:hypothetical protein
MNDATIKLLQSLADAVGASLPMILGHYTTWHLVSALGWIAFGSFIVFTSTKWIPDEDVWDPTVAGIVRILLLFVGGIFIFVNLPDIFSPQAAAIHQLLTDIHPKK